MGVFNAKEAITVKALRAYIAEFMGMFFFLFTTIGVVTSTKVDITSSSNNDVTSDILTIAFAFGMTIMVLVYTTAFDSNQFNPAVTAALMVFGKLNVFQGLINMVVQFLGAMCGVGLVYAIWPSTYHQQAHLGVNGVSAGVSLPGAFFAEFIGTALLCYTVAGVAVDKRNQRYSNIVSGLAIGFAVFLAHIMLIPITGCGINPARSFASAVVSGQFTYLWLYIIAPFAGGIAGFVVHYFAYQYNFGGDLDSSSADSVTKHSSHNSISNGKDDFN
eukprot:Pgem_evm1s8677